MTCSASVPRKSIRFRARSFVAFALTPEAPLETWLADLDGCIENSPGFFGGRPVVLDLNLLKPDEDGIAAVSKALAERGIRIYAIELDGADRLDPELPPLLAGAKEASIESLLAKLVEEEAGDAEEEEPEARAPNSLLIEAPVRSGQSIFHPEGDVIVLGSVASGSEIIAGGSIHVYGTLRGRAFAGATGEERARIFCRRNEAELLAIDGWYRTAEDMDPSSRGGPIQASLDDNVVRVTALK